MARQPPSPASQSQDSRTQVKPEKQERVKTEKGKQVNAAGSSRRDRARDDDAQEAEGDDDAEADIDAEGEEDDAEGEVDDAEDDQGEGSPRSRKRARVNDDGEAVPGSSQTKGKEKAHVKTLPRDADGFIPGSIVRIQLQNFVTYDWVEFCPGPYLNMILGPNGTGKSSIACAICLGLNWPPSILGRASDLNSFVKHDTDKAHIELELKGPKGKSNLIIRRNLSAKSKSSTFTLNGQPASGREITQKMAELNVQVGNLCSFLPQDKVSEFAAMTPQQLLKETQRAAGDENLTSWHETLISSGKDLKQMQELMNNERQSLKTMQERNDDLERDVLRYKERKKIEHEIELLQVLIPVQEYREMRTKFMEIRKQQRALHDKVTKLKEKNAPAHDLLKQFEAMYVAHGNTREQRKRATKAKFDAMRKKSESSEKLENEADDLSMKLAQLKRAEKERLKDIKKLEADIAKLKAEIEKHKEVKIEKEDDIRDELRQLNLERQDLVHRKGSLNDRIRQNSEDTGKCRAEITSCQHDLASLDDARNRKMHELQRWDKDTHDAVVWLRGHRDLFKEEVFEPPMISLTVPQPQFTNAVEALFSGQQLKTFVAQNQADYDTFNHHVNDSGALGRKVWINTWYRAASAIPPPPMAPDELKRLGFDGYAIDYVDCPEGLKWFLKRELNLHRTAIGLDSSKIDVNQAMAAVSRIGPNGEGGGASFINGMTLNMVSRSRYGRRAAQNMTRDVRPARNLKASGVDPEMKKNIDARMAAARQQLAGLGEDDAQIKIELAALNEEDSVSKRKMQALTDRREAIKRYHARTLTLNSRLTRSIDSHTTAVNAPSAEAERTRLKEKLLDMTKKRMIIAREYAELVRGVIADQVEATRVGLEYLQVGANKTSLQELCNKKDEKYQEAVMQFNKVDAEFREIKTQSKEALAASREMVVGIDDDLRQAYNEIENARLAWEKAVAEAEEAGRTPPPSDGVDVRTSVELRDELDVQRAKLELNLNTNPGVVEQYENRKREIENLTRTLEERERRAAKVERAIKNARDNWQPALEKLVASIGEKFSAAFDRIGCAGEIRISEHEDYDKWAIDILVKFRDSEKLQLLTGQRQSGGERSLTTILYLMSLTEEARAPFSLVDEINQGMDARAERVVHNSMVEVTCKADSAQYFLITPKLLADLEYHERMKVLCVNNGEWLPEERDLGNMMNMIVAYEKTRARTAAASRAASSV